MMFVMCCMAHFSRKAISVRPELLVFFLQVFFHHENFNSEKAENHLYSYISLSSKTTFMFLCNAFHVDSFLLSTILLDWCWLF